MPGAFLNSLLSGVSTGSLASGVAQGASTGISSGLLSGVSGSSVASGVGNSVASGLSNSGTSGSWLNSLFGGNGNSILGTAGILGSALLGSSASKSAASQQAAADQQALALQQAIWQNTQKNMAPYINAGQGALGSLNSLLGLGGSSSSGNSTTNGVNTNKTNGPTRNPAQTALNNSGGMFSGGGMGSGVPLGTFGGGNGGSGFNSGQGNLNFDGTSGGISASNLNNPNFSAMGKGIGGFLGGLGGGIVGGPLGAIGGRIAGRALTGKAAAPTTVTSYQPMSGNTGIQVGTNLGGGWVMGPGGNAFNGGTEMLGNGDIVGSGNPGMNSGVGIGAGITGGSDFHLLTEGGNGSRAFGGPTGPGDYVVGEQGPEILHMTPGSRGFVTPNPRTAAHSPLAARHFLEGTHRATGGFVGGAFGPPPGSNQNFQGGSNGTGVTYPSTLPPTYSGGTSSGIHTPQPLGGPSMPPVPQHGVLNGGIPQTGGMSGMPYPTSSFGGPTPYSNGGPSYPGGLGGNTGVTMQPPQGTFGGPMPYQNGGPSYPGGNTRLPYQNGGPTYLGGSTQGNPYTVGSSYATGYTPRALGGPVTGHSGGSVNVNTVGGPVIPGILPQTNGAAMNGSGLNATTYGNTLSQNLTQNPAYQFDYGQGLNAIDQMNAAEGGLLSGGALMGAQQYGQNEAANSYQNIYNNLMGIAGLGEAAAAGQASSGVYSGFGQASSASGAGAAAASGTIGAANAYESGLGNLGYLFGMYGGSGYPGG